MAALLKTVTLGCKVNQYETEFVREGLHTIGYRDAVDEEPADLCIVNTCTVTNEGDAKSRKAIRRLARANPDARIVVMGCYATRAPDEIARLPNVAEVVTDKRELPDLLGRFGVVDVPTGISRFAGRHRAYVKVNDGCLLRCSYCIIPHVRPELTSRPLAHLVDEVRRLVANNYREIVLTGVHLGHYGVDLNRRAPKSDWVRLADVVRALVALDGEFRIRLSSIEATEVTRDLIQAMVDGGDKVCPHLHLCMQSGSDRVLRRMRRRWSTRMFLDRCRLLREALDSPAITTDVIVGFPGETEEDFQSTCRASRDAGFSKIHVFPFSPRRGTDAAIMTDQVEPGVKADRAARLSELEVELRSAYFHSLIGRRLQVMAEAPREETAADSSGRLPAGDDARSVSPLDSAGKSTLTPWTGTSCRYAPVEFGWDDNCSVGSFCDSDVEGRLYEVHVESAAADRLVGRVTTGG